MHITDVQTYNFDTIYSVMSWHFLAFATVQTFILCLIISGTSRMTICTLLNPLVIKNIEGRIYPKISIKVVNDEPFLMQYFISNLVINDFTFIPYRKGLNQHSLNCIDVRRCSWFSGELAHVECLESIVRSSDLSTCVPKSPWAM